MQVRVTLLVEELQIHFNLYIKNLQIRVLGYCGRFQKIATVLFSSSHQECHLIWPKECGRTDIILVLSLGLRSLAASTFAHLGTHPCYGQSVKKAGLVC